MEHLKEDGKVSTNKKKVTLNTVPIRVTKGTARTIRSIIHKLNKKPLGRRVVFDDVVSTAVSLLQDKHFEAIKESTYSGKDHMELKYKEYCRINGYISKERFLEILLGLLPLDSGLRDAL